MTTPEILKTQILVADDVAIMRRLLIKYLNEAGAYEIRVADNGKDVMKAFETGPVDLLFLDLNMPQMTGMQALREIYALDPNTYVVIVTGEGTMNNVMDTLDLGAKAFIVKPYTQQKIADVLSAYVQRDVGASDA